jgi:hypothetical protein
LGAFKPNPRRNYIWIFDPIKSQYFYYAHLNEVFIKVGQVVSEGERLGTVGRTGIKAYPKNPPLTFILLSTNQRMGIQNRLIPTWN